MVHDASFTYIIDYWRILESLTRHLVASGEVIESDDNQERTDSMDGRFERARGTREKKQNPTKLQVWVFTYDWYKKK